MSESKHAMNRRAFLAATTTTALAAGCATTKPNTAEVVPGKKSPNEKLNIAAIGAGGKGMEDLWQCHLAGHNIVALCDPDRKSSEQAVYKLPGAKYHTDYRKMLDEMKEIDACTISTPDHTHAPAAYRAMKLGKHVYTQKPLTHTIAEAYLLQRTAAEMGVVTQMGHQGHSGNGVRELCEMLWGGAIGEVKTAHIWTNRPIWPQGIDKPLPAEKVPDTMDWDLWIGTSPMREYNAKYAPFNWRGWWDWGCGAIGDMACHIMDPAFWAMKLIDANHFSCEVVSQEGNNAQTGPLKSIIKFQFPKRGDQPACEVYWYDGDNHPPRPEGVAPEEKLGDGTNGSSFVGTAGILSTGTYGGSSRLLPTALMADYKKPAPSIPRVPGENHYKNWCDAILNGGKANSDFAYSAPLTVVANMGNVALRAGTRIEFDVKAMKVTNNKAANQFLGKEYRKGWELPV